MNKIQSLELKIAKFLRIGVIISGILMLIGWFWEFKYKANPFYFFATYDPLPLKDLLFFYIAHKKWGVLLTYTGLIVLIFLPFIRVLLTAILFIRQKEYALAGVAMLVLIGLIISMSFGIDL